MPLGDVAEEFAELIWVEKGPRDFRKFARDARHDPNKESLFFHGGRTPKILAEDRRALLYFRLAKDREWP